MCSHVGEQMFGLMERRFSNKISKKSHSWLRSSKSHDMAYLLLVCLTSFHLLSRGKSKCVFSTDHFRGKNTFSRLCTSHASCGTIPLTLSTDEKHPTLTVLSVACFFLISLLGCCKISHSWSVMILAYFTPC